MQKFFRNLLVALSLMTAFSVMTPTLARADGWGCQVLLCLANPGGPEQYSECVPPIEQLWSALSHGDPFPTCDFAAGLANLTPDEVAAIPPAWLSNLGAGTGATNTWASGGYCREDLLYWGGPEQSVPMCNASGAINVMIDGQLYTRVWWGTRGPGGSSTITEYYGSSDPSINVPGIPLQQAYDPTKAEALWLEQQQVDEPSAN